MSKHKNFVAAFSPNVASCRAQCACGKEFYNPDDSWDWGDGELEALENDTNAFPLDACVGYIEFEGVTYVADCSCWHNRAKQVIAFIDLHADKIVSYLKKEKERKLAEANSLDLAI